jgi:hypothetical protein
MTTRKTETSATPATRKRAPAKSAAPSAAKAAPPAANAVAKPVAKPVAKAVRAAPAAKKPKAKEPKIKEPKVKVVRDSFTMPQGEYLKIAEIKEAALKAGVPVKKSEVLRAGLKALVAMSPARLKVALAGLEKIKTGRPKKH